MPAFSPAILPSVAPSFSAWSIDTGVMTVSAGRSHDVGRIEPAAETDLQQQRIGRMLGEGEERRRGRDLELRDVVAVVHGLRARQHIDERLLADRPRLAVLAGELDALVKAHEMRRGVDVHAPARGLQHGLQDTP